MRNLTEKEIMSTFNGSILKKEEEKIMNTLPEIPSVEPTDERVPIYYIKVPIENQNDKAECYRLLSKLEQLSASGNKLAYETVNYFTKTWKYKLYRYEMYRSVISIFKETIDSIEKGLYE